MDTKQLLLGLSIVSLIIILLSYDNKNIPLSISFIPVFAVLLLIYYSVQWSKKNIIIFIIVTYLTTYIMFSTSYSSGFKTLHDLIRHPSSLMNHGMNKNYSMLLRYLSVPTALFYYTKNIELSSFWVLYIFWTFGLFFGETISGAPIAIDQLFLVPLLFSTTIMNFIT